MFELPNNWYYKHIIQKQDLYCFRSMYQVIAFRQCIWFTLDGYEIRLLTFLEGSENNSTRIYIVNTIRVHRVSVIWLIRVPKKYFDSKSKCQQFFIAKLRQKYAPFWWFWSYPKSGPRIARFDTSVRYNYVTIHQEIGHFCLRRPKWTLVRVGTSFISYLLVYTLLILNP